MVNLNDKLVLESWNNNASAWINTIENEEIESRKLVTNQAIVDAINSYSPNSILDIGCGEGWLTRKLTIKGIEAWGVDGVSSLIKKAQLMNCGKFLVASYEDIIHSHKIDIQFDAAVCNFSLLGKETVDNLIYSIPGLLKNNQLLFIQTLHPVIAKIAAVPGGKYHRKRSAPDAVLAVAMQLFLAIRLRPHLVNYSHRVIPEKY